MTAPTRVVNIRREPYDVYIGRPGHGEAGPFGNPIRAGQRCPQCAKIHEDRASVIACYETWLRWRVRVDPEFRAAVRGLAGLRLGCFCAPLPCHGDVLAVVADELAAAEVVPP